MDISARLEEIDAPPEIAAWASSFTAFDDAWGRCPDSRYRIWLAGAGGSPVETIVESAAAGFFALAEHEPSVEALVGLVEQAVGAVDAETCAALAERCERDAGAGAPYRDDLRRQAFARAASDVCRGFEALRSAESSAESARLNRARATAAYMGGGTQAFLPAEAGPISLARVAPESAEHGLLVLAIASAAEAVGALVVLAGNNATSVDDAVWDVLAPT